jgi:UDP-N-acetylmuramate dehydrogenase
VLAGGSNVVIGDAGFPARCCCCVTGASGWWRRGKSVVLRVAAGEVWDDFVEYAVSNGWSGVECLSGIPARPAPPRSRTSAPTARRSRTRSWPCTRTTGSTTRSARCPRECGFAYRSSVFKHSDRFLGHRRRLPARGQRRLRADPLRRAGARPGRRGRRPGAAAPGPRHRAEAARAKGNGARPDDKDTWSVGSFFTNPVVSAERWSALGLDAPHWPGDDGTVKIPAAWLIEHAGFPRASRATASRSRRSTRSR